MKLLKIVLVLAIASPLLCIASAVAYFRIAHPTDLTVEVVNHQAGNVPRVVVLFVEKPCGPTDLAPGQSTVCRFNRGKGGVTFRVGQPPAQLAPGNYVMGGRPTAHRLTLEADGGMTFQCLLGWCASDGGALDPVHVVPRADTPSPPPPIAPDGGPSSPGSQPGAAGPAQSTVRGGDERRLSD